MSQARDVACGPSCTEPGAWEPRNCDLGRTGGAGGAVDQPWVSHPGASSRRASAPCPPCRRAWLSSHQGHRRAPQPGNTEGLLCAACAAGPRGDAAASSWETWVLVAASLCPSDLVGGVSPASPRVEPGPGQRLFDECDWMQGTRDWPTLKLTLPLMPSREVPSALTPNSKYPHAVTALGVCVSVCS